MTIQEALSGFYAENNFEDDGGLQSNWAWLQVGPFKVPMPNPEVRKKALYLHDVHHLITGYGTNWKGESSISGWELATGGWGTNFFVWMLIMGGFLIGVVVYPVATFKAFVRGRQCKSLVAMNLPKKNVMQFDVEALKKDIGLNQSPKVRASILDIVQYISWILTGLICYFAPLVLMVFLLK